MTDRIRAAAPLSIALSLVIALSALLSGCSGHSEAATPAPLDLSPSSTEATVSVPDATAAPAADSAPLPTVAPTPEPVMLKSRVMTLNYRSRPDKDDDSAILGQLGYEETVEYIATEGEFTLMRIADGREVYCYSDYLVGAEVTLYAYLSPETAQKKDIPTGDPVFEDDGVTPVMVTNELVDMRLYLPDAEYMLLFATEQNITGAPLYPRAIPLMQKGTVEKLKKAYDLFKADGYTLRVYDAYRPVRVQRILYDIVQNKHWIANPDTTASNHNRGCAIDMNLVLDATGEEILSPTPVHTFTADSARDSKTWTEEATKNVEYITEVMKECGFNSIKSEWWHYSDTDSKKYMTTDIDLGGVNMLPKQ